MPTFQAAAASTGGNTFVPSDFIIVENVPVFDETSGYSEDDLQRIVDNNNRRIADTGDEVPLIIGHTENGSTEEENEVVGYATNFRLGNIGKVKPRKAILATFKYFKDKWEKARNFQRRSVELWPEPDLFIDPIALLGPHTPHCDLGLTPRVTYAREGEKIICILEENSAHPATYQQKPNGGSVENSELFVKEIYEKLTQSEEFSFIRQLMKERAAKAEKDDDEEKKSEEPEKHAEEEKPDKDEDKEEKYRMQKDQLAGQVEKYRREAEATRRELDAIQRKFRRAERERDLVRLETQEGIIFDLAEEMDEVQDMTPEQYGKHVHKMRTRYQRIPDGLTVPVKAPTTTEKAFSEADMWKAITLTKEKGVSYEQAVNLVKQEGNVQ